MHEQLVPLFMGTYLLFFNETGNINITSEISLVCFLSSNKEKNGASVVCVPGTFFDCLPTLVKYLRLKSPTLHSHGMNII